MEVNTTRRAAGLREKIPDIQKTVEMVGFLGLRKVRVGKSETVLADGWMDCGFHSRSERERDLAKNAS